jgi:hypothetical protein
MTRNDAIELELVSFSVLDVVQCEGSRTARDNFGVKVSPSLCAFKSFSQSRLRRAEPRRCVKLIQDVRSGNLSKIHSNFPTVLIFRCRFRQGKSIEAQAFMTQRRRLAMKKRQSADDEWGLACRL